MKELSITYRILNRILTREHEEILYSFATIALYVFLKCFLCYISDFESCGTKLCKISLEKRKQMQTPCHKIK